MRIRTMLMLVLVLALIGVVGYAFLSPSLGFDGLMAQPTSTIKPGMTVLQAIKRQAKLSTLSMSFTKDTTIIREHGVLGACTEEITYLGYFNVQAGIDLSKISEERLIVSNDGYPDQATVEIVLPDSELLSNELDTQNSRIIAQDTPKWLPGCSHEIADMTVEAQNTLREQVRQDALEKGILSQSQQQASEELGRLLTDVGYKNITIRASNGSVLYSTKSQ